MPKEYFKLYPSRANIWESLTYLAISREKNWQKTEVSSAANYKQITAEATQTYDLYQLYTDEMSPWTHRDIQSSSDRTIQKRQNFPSGY